MKWQLSLHDIDHGWLEGNYLEGNYYEDFMKFILVCTHRLSYEQIRRVSDAMVNAGMHELAEIEKRQNNEKY